MIWPLPLILDRFVVQGPDLLEDSSELIYAGEMNKVNSAGWSQERNFFLFDHQLVYCKKVTNYCFVSKVPFNHTPALVDAFFLWNISQMESKFINCNYRMAIKNILYIFSKLILISTGTYMYMY